MIHRTCISLGTFPSVCPLLSSSSGWRTYPTELDPLLRPDETEPYLSEGGGRECYSRRQRLELAEVMMHEADVDPNLRPTELSIPDRGLADTYSCLCSENQGLLTYDFRLKHLNRRSGSSTQQPLTEREARRTEGKECLMVSVRDKTTDCS
ncbi:dimethyladenosine transferase 1, mitochondrial-like isoform X1 [Oncorhynchus keta]|uniref:dimethyladenosine transferase 1, mitochondrial-like isoform X1 n=1 Tax=Oncorhynchus keta TaxID=8018 RepID=UPI0015F94C83|nr:dimethyladenosine transferase 1, mitochondrial-like isoform X1 [Oncorhynchus keta]